MKPSPTRGTARELVNEADADLLVYMTMADDEPAYARAAWEVFYRRHVDYLYRVCLRAYRDLVGGEAGVADLVAEAFRTAYERADKFDPADITDRDRQRLRVRAWLGWIVKHLLQESLRGRSRLPTRELDLRIWQQIPEKDRQVRAPSEREQLVRQAILRLTEREQLVIRVTFQWYQPGRPLRSVASVVGPPFCRGPTPKATELQGLEADCLDG